LLRLLADHPALTPAVAGAHARAGSDVGTVHPQLGAAAGTLVDIAAALEAEVDVCFSCLPHGELPPLLEGAAARVIVDLADDHRGDSAWAYGLPELNRAALAGAARVANPGCYPTATLLCTAPFAAAGVISSPVIVDALSGTSGAGRAAAGHLMLAEATANATAYGTVEHRHVPEMERGLQRFGGLAATVSFTPHLVPMARGVLVTVRAPLTADLDDDGARAILRDAYASEPFVEVLDSWPATKPLTGTNRAHVSARVDARSGFVVASAALDNLGKGAAGQAIQNANALLGIEETAGLSALGVWP
jgi:N-acetyl-gamma-glutamyl-phosphate reductase